MTDFIYTPYTPWLLVKERPDLQIGQIIELPGGKSPYQFTIVEVEKGYEPKPPDDKVCPFNGGDLLVVEGKMLVSTRIAGVDYQMVSTNAVQGKVEAIG